MSVQELITKQTLCNKQSWAEQDQFFGGLEAPDTPGLREVLLGLAGGFNQHRKQCASVEKSWGWTMEQAVNKHFCLLPRSGDSRDPVVVAKNNCSPVIVAVWICETALLAPNSRELLDVLSSLLRGQLPDSGRSHTHHRFFPVVQP